LVGGHRLSRLGIAGIRHIAVLIRDNGGGSLDERFLEFVRRFNIGIAEAEIKNIFRTELFPQVIAFLKHFPNP
jgi:hypothetical protein